MASSDYDTYGRLHAKSCALSNLGVKIIDDADDTKSITLKGPATYNAGNADITLPNAAGALLSDQSTLPGANLGAGSVATAALADSAVTAAKVNINGASNVAAAADTDEVMVYDASGTANGKMALSVIKTYVGAGLPTGNTEANVLVADGAGDFQSVAMSGDCTVAASGAVTIANDAISGAKVADDGIGASKLDINGSTSVVGPVQDADEAMVYDSSALANRKLAMSDLKAYTNAGQISMPAGGTSGQIVTYNGSNAPINVTMSGDVTMDNTGVTSLGTGVVDTAQLANNSVDSNKVAPSVAFGTSVRAPVILVDTDKWRITLSGNDLVFQYWNGASWDTKQTFSST